MNFGAGAEFSEIAISRTFNSPAPVRGPTALEVSAQESLIIMLEDWPCPKKIDEVGRGVISSRVLAIFAIFALSPTKVEKQWHRKALLLPQTTSSN